MNYTFVKIAILALSSSILLTACDSNSDDENSVTSDDASQTPIKLIQASQLEGTKWQLVNPNEANASNTSGSTIANLYAQKDSTNIEFPNNNRLTDIHYTVGCNNFQGSYVLNNNQLIASEIISTKTYCADKDSAEKILTNILTNASEIELLNINNFLYLIMKQNGEVLTWNEVKKEGAKNFTATVKATKVIGGVAGSQALDNKTETFNNVSLPSTKEEFCDGFKLLKYRILDGFSSNAGFTTCEFEGGVGKFTTTSGTTTYEYEVSFAEKVIEQQKRKANIKATKLIGGVAGNQVVETKTQVLNDVILPISKDEFCNANDLFKYRILDGFSSYIGFDVCEFSGNVGKFSTSSGTSFYEYEITFN